MAALKIDELGRDWWPPDAAVRDMYRHVDPALARWAAARLRPDANPPGGYPLQEPPKLLSRYIYATDDELFTPESRRWAARNIFGVEAIAIEGGHFPMLERPSELADLLVAGI